ncbi:MAG TPA: hypothetical protein VGX71_25435 [Pseudaminobacter sp.]|nr:hypothetical protein [Pseudaminobacter sp.]
MPTDTENLVLSISADVTNVRRALQRLMGESKQAATAIADSFGTGLISAASAAAAAGRCGA